MAIENNDLMYTSFAFQEFFKRSQHALVIKAKAPEFMVLAVSDHYLNLVHKKREDVIGRGIFEVFPGSAGDASEQFSVYNSFCRVIANATQDILPVFKYEIYLPETGTMETYYWSNINDPVFNASGEVAYIINNTANITKQVEKEALLAEVSQQIKSLQREQILNTELSATNEQLLVVQQEMYLLNQELEARVAQRTQSLAESEARFRNMAENSAVLIAVSDENNLPIYFNNAWTVLTGRKQEQLLSLDFVKILHPFDQEKFTDALRESRSQLKPWKMEFRIIDQHGCYCWLLANGTLRYDANGSFAGYVSSCIDITENKNQQAELEKLNVKLEAAYQKQAKSNIELAQVNDKLLSVQNTLIQNNGQLAENEQILQMAIQSNAMGTWQVNLKTGQLISSEKSKQIHGIADNAILGMSNLLSTIDVAFQESFMNCIKEAILNQSSFITEYLIYPADDSGPKWVRLSGVVRVDAQMQPVSILGTILDITEQKQDEVRKNDFISMVSHELKTPLTSINAYVQIMQAKINKEEVLLNNLLAKTSKQTIKMIKMINGFLNVSRLESGKILIDCLHFDLALLLKEIEEEGMSSVTTHKILFAPAEETWVNADKDKLTQVIENLISNAVKYSPLGSVIDIACVTVGGDAMVSVRDYGFGIDSEDIPKLFDRFYRVKSHARNISGFGIGLYLCREIIDRHHGRLWVESQIDQGSTFYFTVPVLI